MWGQRWLASKAGGRLSRDEKAKVGYTHLLEDLHGELRRYGSAGDELVEGIGESHANARRRRAIKSGEYVIKVMYSRRATVKLVICSSHGSR